MAVWPKIAPAGYALDITDFLRTKVDRSGAVRLITGNVSITSGTTLGTQIGLAPFNYGAKLLTAGSQIYTPQLDNSSSMTFSFGYQYNDSSSAGANSPSNTSAYTSSDSHCQLSAGGLFTIGGSTVGSSLTDNRQVDLQGNGWFTLTINGTLTNQAAASVTFGLAVSYDPSGITN